jgi:hypothetical protein
MLAAALGLGSALGLVLDLAMALSLLMAETQASALQPWSWMPFACWYPPVWIPPQKQSEQP